MAFRKKLIGRRYSRREYDIDENGVERSFAIRPDDYLSIDRLQAEAVAYLERHGFEAGALLKEDPSGTLFKSRVLDDLDAWTSDGPIGQAASAVLAAARLRDWLTVLNQGEAERVMQLTYSLTRASLLLRIYGERSSQASLAGSAERRSDRARRVAEFQRLLRAGKSPSEARSIMLARGVFGSRTQIFEDTRHLPVR